MNFIRSVFLAYWDVFWKVLLVMLFLSVITFAKNKIKKRNDHEESKEE